MTLTTVIELGIGVGSPPIEVHVGGCYAAGKGRRAITREQALAALADGIRACIHCRPRRRLGPPRRRALDRMARRPSPPVRKLADMSTPKTIYTESEAEY
ncbi:DUF6233 domain-containing protein [Streptomyces sp. NPDC005134]|uniref:DUF6233 domain-containing protein n=1 Tax=Streptomyces sp. NPDC005098 TaxID=3154560 RepID=UPI0033AB9C5D